MKTPFHFGPGLPQGFCLHAAQAVFDENPTLWRDADVQSSQTECPKCGVAMVVRVASWGARKGERFLGCANYPRCTHTAGLPGKLA